MQTNIGKSDRTIRLAVGVVIIAAGLYYQSWWGAIGLLPLLTGLLRWCPPYQLLGISTDRK
ncbi:MAG: DUF2892 domain-containing protein [Xanthomonadales bacterium]|nr:DUF2892 domain-containing protein [Xanthomonadales bacterium]